MINKIDVSLPTGVYMSAGETDRMTCTINYLVVIEEKLQVLGPRCGGKERLRNWKD